MLGYWREIVEVLALDVKEFVQVHSVKSRQERSHRVATTSGCVSRSMTAGWVSGTFHFSPGGMVVIIISPLSVVVVIPPLVVVIVVIISLAVIGAATVVIPIIVSIIVTVISTALI